MSSLPIYLSSAPPHRASSWKWSSDNAAEQRSLRFDIQKVRVEPEAHDLTVLKEKQRSLRAQLAATQEQQVRENSCIFSRAAFSLSHPDSLEMSIYGLREQLERVAQEIAAHS